MNAPVYLDYNATAPALPASIAAVSAALAETGNASSVHRFGRLARRTVETAREQVAALVNAPAASIVFTGSGTEANNLAIAHARTEGRRLIVSAVEHDSVLRAAPDAAIAPVDGDGVVDLAALERSLAGSSQPALVAVMLANNETGVIQPVAEIARLAHAHGAIVHCDAVQAAGKMAIDVPALGADTLALSAHKLGGPQGVGALFVSDRVVLQAQLVGGGQERGRRAGTENVAGIAGFGAAAHSAADLSQMGAIARLRDATEARLRNIAPRAVVFGAKAARLPNTICVAMPGVAAETQVMALDLAGIAVSAGAACSSGKVKASHVLAAMGVAPELAGSAMRVSAGWRSTAEDFDRFVDAWTALWARLGAPRVGSVAPAA
jgi:cysteine desulfurase